MIQKQDIEEGYFIKLDSRVYKIGNYQGTQNIIVLNDKMYRESFSIGYLNEHGAEILTPEKDPEYFL